MSKIDRILDDIDSGLDGNVIYMPADLVQSLEEDVWLELYSGVEHGWTTMEQATERFLAWRQTHRSLGQTAITPPPAV